MTSDTFPAHSGPALGRRAASLTPGVGSSLRTVALGAVLLAGPVVGAVTLPDRTVAVTVLFVVVGAIGLCLLLAGLVELLPGPGRVQFHEHGFVHVRRTGEVDAHLHGEAEPVSLSPRSARTRTIPASRVQGSLLPAKPRLATRRQAPARPAAPVPAPTPVVAR